MSLQADWAADFAAFIAEYPDRTVHWYPMPGDGFCEEYVTGDVVVDLTCGTASQVTCEECIEWMHA